jgi:hypothetical protein
MITMTIMITTTTIIFIISKNINIVIITTTTIINIMSKNINIVIITMTTITYYYNYIVYEYYCNYDYNNN